MTSFELTTKESTYNEEVVDLASLGSIVQAKVGDSTATLVYGTDYELVVNPDGEAMNIQDVGTYTIGLKILSSLYADTSKRTCEYKVNPLALSSFELADDSKSSTYDRNAVAITSLSAVVQADTYAGTITLKNTDYKLTYNGEIKDANKYVINIEVSNPNFVNSGNLTAEYTVNPAPVASFALTTRSSVYDGNEVSVGDLSATVTAGDNGDLTLEDGEFALKNSGANPIKDADSYDIGFELKSDNFTVTGFNGPFTDIYTVNPAPLFGFSLDEEGSVYDRNTVDPNNLQATVTAGETGALTLDRSDFELTCAETIQDAKTYDIGIAKLNNTNYTMEGTVPDATLPYTVYPAPVESVAVNPGYSYFNQEEVALGTLSATVKANGLTLNDNEYTLTCDDQILNVGSYTVGLADLSSNFSNDNGVTGIYEVKAATVIHVELTDTTSTYDQEAVAPEGLNAVVKALAGSEEITLDPADYTLVCDTEIRNAGTYSVGIALNTGNYVNPSNWKDTYTVTKATLSGVELVQPSSVYDQEAVDPAMLTATVRATCDSGEIILPAEAYTLTCAETIRNVGEYTIGVALVDTNNYAANDSVVAQYTVAQATVSSVALDETGSIYSQEAVDPASLTATVKAMAGDKEITLPVDAYTLVCEESIVDAGTYAIGIALTDTNYTDPDHCTDTYTVTPAQLEQLTLGVSALIYDQQDVDLSALKPTVTAQTNGGKLITLPYGDADAAYAVVFNGNATDATVKNAGEYTLEVALIDDVNYAGAASAVFTVTPAALEQLTLGVSALTYDQQDVDLTALQPTVTAQANNGEIITLPYGGADAAYAVVFNGNGTDAAVKDAGAYKLEVELLDTRNYVGAAEATFTVNPAALHELTLGVSELIYNQKEVDLTALQPTATAEANDGETITLPYAGADAAYEIVFNGNQTDSIVMNAGEYALEVKLLDTRNYAGETSAIFTVAPATLEQLTLGVTTLIYDQEDVDLAALQPTVTARTNGGEIITLPYGGADTAYAVVFNGDASNATVRNAGTYKLEVKLTDARNYAGTAAADFVVTPAKVKQLTLGVKQSVYDRNAVDLTMLEPTVTAVTNGDAIITLPYGDEDAAYYIDGVEAVQVGDYVFGVKLIDQLNYEADTEITDTYAILRMPVAPLSMTANVTNSDGEYVLGGPVSEGHRTITIKGEPNELVYVVANGAVQSDLLKLNESGVATLTVDGNGTAGKLALGEKAELVLDGSGLGQAFALTVAYEDAANLRDGKEEAAPAQPQASYRYDMEAVTVEVAQLNNRSAQGVVVSLPEDLAEIAFASRSNAQIPFSGSRSGLVKGDAQVIGFNGTNKLNSTELDGNSVYDVTYTDLVGNTGAVVDQTVNKSGGTLKIDSVDPALNSNKRIGNTNKLTWTITCSFGGSSEEKASLTIGNKTFNKVLKNGVNTVEINAGDISSGTLLNVSAKFEDLSASATFESFVYDAKCETPVLTSMLYSECYVLTGMVEPGSRIVLRVNNERVDCKIDSFGTFAANMPVVYEGDKIEVVVTDLADNVTVKSFVVGPALELVQMKAYMMGKVYTNADKVQEGEEPDWTTITTVTKDELKTGKVNLPIVAGNMIQVGTMTMSMDDKGGISYDYELNEGVVLVSEDVRVYTTRSKEDSMAHTGVLLTRGETTQVPNKKNQYYVTAEFVVEVEANQLTTTFQLESAAKSDLKMEYRDRQNNKPLK
ncbi:MAG: MBG domain-containing protein [Aristaeellaceae bacterium]